MVGRLFGWIVILLASEPIFCVGYAQIAINEIHFDAEPKNVPVEFVELLNAGTNEVDVSGWSISGDIHFTFPKQSVIPSGGYVVVAENPDCLRTHFNLSSQAVFGPYTNALPDEHGSVALSDASGLMADVVNYDSGFPWPVAASGAGHSMELINASLDNNLGASWRSSGTVLSPAPTPAAVNSVFASNAPPQIRQVGHHPKQPMTGQFVTVVAKVTDPDGVAGVTLSYQIVEPGHYIRKTDGAYANQWAAIVMNDAGMDGDSTANDDVYSALIPATVQAHRRLIRYRITATDRLGYQILVPYADDDQPNFAYFCYDGVPAWDGAAIPGETPVLHFPADLMGKALPVYHLIVDSHDIVQLQYDPSDMKTRFLGTLVYDGEVYDHIEYRIRGEGSTYVTGKVKWRIYLNRAHRFAARDNYGREYNQKAHTINLNACASPYIPANRGMAGLDEAVAFRLFQLAGLPSSHTHWVQFRVIDEAGESSPLSQFDGDLWGLYLYIERTDGQFLKEHGYPDGDVYMMSGGNTLSAKKINQSRDRPLELDDWYRFDGDSQGHLGEAWWRQNLDLEAYYSFHGITRAINNLDLNIDINYGFYRPPDGHWQPIPWDLDALFIAGYHYPAVIPQTACLEHEPVQIECRNRCRELLDLLFSDPGDYGGQAAQVVEELASLVNPPGRPLTFADVDQALWNFSPRTSELHRGQFYANPASHLFGDFLVTRTLASADHEGFEKYLKDFMTDTDADAWSLGDGDQRGYGFNYLESEAAFANQPGKPSIRYAGAERYPIGNIRFAASAFDPGSPGNDAQFTGMKWRLAEVSNPSTPLFIPSQPWKYEITPVWESPVIETFQNEIDIPANAMVPGRTYRVRVKMRNGVGAWSHWSDPIAFTPSRTASQVVINEWMSDNRTTIVDPANGRYDDWFELHNTGSVPVDLSGCYLTDDLAQTNRWAIPQGTVLAPYGFLLVWADGETEQNQPGEALHANFQLAASGEAIGLFGPHGQLMDSIFFDAQPPDFSQGRWPDGGTAISNLEWPTPGLPNRILNSNTTLRITGFQRMRDGQLHLSWKTVSGHYYRIQYKQDLRESSWKELLSLKAISPEETVVLPKADAATRLFRVVLAD